MQFCTYCGKRFTRKEHLERHLPSHTNVKPHRCTFCHVSFSRRDLLQRHHTTYHEYRDPIKIISGPMPPIHGRTPIACQNCANAKTGCDKHVPCSRCADKNLPCEARFARRSSKAAIRAAQANAAAMRNNNNNSLNSNTNDSDNHNHNNQALPHISVPQPLMDMDPSSVKQPSPNTQWSAMMPDLSPDQSPAIPQRENSDLCSPHNNGMSDFMQLGGDFVAPESYLDLLVCPEYMDMYPGMPLRNDIDISGFGEISELRSNSEPISAPSSSSSTHTRGTSIMSAAEFDSTIRPLVTGAGSLGDSDVPEFEVVMVAEAAWPLARCNPPSFSGACPRTAIVHLECLERKSKEEGTWAPLERYLSQVEWDTTDLPDVVTMTQRTRDRMQAIAQSFLHKALEIHRGRAATAGGPGGDFNFIVLPPINILKHFLRSYVRNLAYYYTLVAAGSVDPNDMLSNNQASTLLVLLMIAQGAAAVPIAEARYLAAGLTETCRISLFDIIEKDVELSADPVALRCALLFIILGAWSGDKWLMDIVMGQRGMYLSMIKHAGMMEPQLSMIPTINSGTDIELLWRSWLHREGQNRLVYNWVMVDQELSLFHDTAPVLAINDLQCPLPGSELLWASPNAKQWHANVQSLYGCTANVNPQLLNTSTLTPSLFDIFQDLLHDNLSRRHPAVPIPSPGQMRLLLHPLQAMLFHLRQLLACFSDLLSGRRPTIGNTPNVTKASTLARLEEVRALLTRWHELASAYHSTHPDCTTTRCNLVLYHLICLNAVTNFPEMERLARRDGFDGNQWALSMRHKRCIYSREEAVMHCGQVMRLTRSIGPDRRPPWWAAAVYRATLILWVDAIARTDPSFQTPPPPLPIVASPSGNGMGSQPSSPHQLHKSHTPSQLQQRTHTPASSGPLIVAIDKVVPDDPALTRCLAGEGGVAVLTRADGRTVALEKPGEVLAYGVGAIEEGASTRIGDGIKRKLRALGANWCIEGFVGESARKGLTKVI